MASPREKRITLVAAILGSGIVFLDATVVNIALPAIRGDLGGGLAGQQWVVEAYLLTLSALLLIGGSLGDIFGQRRVFFIGVVGFGVASLLCAVAPSIGNLATLTTYMGLGAMTFLLPLFLQQVGSYTPIAAGLALLPITALMFFLSRRFGGVADRIGPRVLMGFGPLIAAVGVLLLLMVRPSADY